MNKHDKIQEAYKREFNYARFYLDEDEFVDSTMAYICAKKEVDKKRNARLPMAYGLVAAALLIGIIIINSDIADNTQAKQMVNVRLVPLPRSAYQSPTDVLMTADLGRTDVTRFLMTEFHHDSRFHVNALQHN